MSVACSSLNQQYVEQGYFVVRDYFSVSEMQALRKTILTFHERWKKDNQTFYEQEAFNSSLITGSEYLNESDRIHLFNFISSNKVMALVNEVLPVKPSFMNTQLFFNPVNIELKDFWHRDCQYDHDLESQKKIIQETQVVHLRVPLFDEPGLELIPGTHKRWDNEEELNVRYELNGKLSNDDLPFSQKVPLNAGDILVFSADMLHRGLYGMNRLALDILVFESSPEYIHYIDEDCLPSLPMLVKIKQPTLYQNTYHLLDEFQHLRE